MATSTNIGCDFLILSAGFLPTLPSSSNLIINSGIYPCDVVGIQPIIVDYNFLALFCTVWRKFSVFGQLQLLSKYCIKPFCPFLNFLQLLLYFKCVVFYTVFWYESSFELLMPSFYYSSYSAMEFSSVNNK